MSQRSIAGYDEGDRDGGLTEQVRTETIRRLQQSMEVDGDAPVDLGPILEAARQAPRWTAKQEARAKEYFQTLAEPQRSMFAKYLDGMRASEIANAMGLQRHAVAKSLAKIVTNLRMFLDHKETSV